MILYLSSSKSCLNIIQAICGTPTFSYQATLGEVKIKHVHCMIDSLDFLYLHVDKKTIFLTKDIKETARRHGDHAIAHNFTTSKIITMFTRIYKT